MAPPLTDERSLIQTFQHAVTEPLKVAFLLPGMARGGSGGTHSLYQETQGLQRLGVDAVAVPTEAWSHAHDTYGDAQSVFVRYAGDDELYERTADRDVIVATHHKSVAQLAAIARRRPASSPPTTCRTMSPSSPRRVRPTQPRRPRP